MTKLRAPTTPWGAQVALVRRWYEPIMEIVYDSVRTRTGDLDKLEQIAASYATRETFLSDLTLDPPEATGTGAQDPLLDEDYLILSTIHSAKGQEWDAVFILNVVDGCIPSDMGAGEQIEEERRLLYVAMTRAKRHLSLIHPLRFFRTHQHRHGDGHVLAPLTRFIPDAIIGKFNCRPWPAPPERDAVPLPAGPRVNVAARMRDMWR